MAEALCVVQNIAGLISGGLTLSKTLYDFASTLGSASEDVKSLATDISLFCSVLKQVQSTLTQPRAFRISLSAIQTAQDVVDRCQIIFDELEGTVKKLQKGDTQLDFLTRVKWFFKEKRILLIHEQLKTCGATLHLMLTTLILAQKIANKQLSLVDDDDEDAQDRLMTHSLFMAQQAASERLSAIEDELMNEKDLLEPVELAPPETLSPPPPEGARIKHRRNRSSRIIDGFVHSPDRPVVEHVKRVSTVVGRHINRLSLIDSVRNSQSSAAEDRRLSILQTDELLRQWTDQSDPLATVDVDSQSNISEASNGRRLSNGGSDDSWVAMDADEMGQAAEHLDIKPHQNFGSPQLEQNNIVQTTNIETFAKNESSVTTESSSSVFLPSSSFNKNGAKPMKERKSLLEHMEVPFQCLPSRRPQPTTDISLAPAQARDCCHDIEVIKTILKKMELEHSQRLEASRKKDKPMKQGPPVDIVETFRVSYDEPCHKVLRHALHGYSVVGDYTTYSLMVSQGEEEREIEFDEKPLLLFKTMEREGKKPVFVLRKRPQPIPWPGSANTNTNTNIYIDTDGKTSGATLKERPPPIQLPLPPEINVLWPPQDADFGPPLPLSLFTATSAVLQVQSLNTPNGSIESRAIASSA